MGCFQIGVMLEVIKKVLLAFLTCVLSLGGAVVGTIPGAIKGHTTETGLLRGAGVGAITGAITALQLMDLMVNGEPFSKVALICSLVNGKVFTEWVSPAVLKAYLWQISALETNVGEVSDIFEVHNGSKGLSQHCINKLPKYKYGPSTSEFEIINSCTICLKDFSDGEMGRMLPRCSHSSFHLQCIDEWLGRNASCPICRRDLE